MIQKQLVIERLTGPDVFHALIETLYNQDEEFRSMYDRYCGFLDYIDKELDADYHSEILMFKSAIMQKTCSSLFYAGCHGFRMNYEHYLDPLKPTCVCGCISFDTYLKTEQMRKLPLYCASSKAIENFKSILSSEQLTQFLNVEEMIGYLDVVAPQLAHYYGYLAANSLLEHLVPGYRGDVLLDIEYTRMLELHLGFKLDHSQWNGVLDLKKWQFPRIDYGDAQSIVLLRNQLIRSPLVSRNT